MKHVGGMLCNYRLIKIWIYLMQILCAICKIEELAETGRKLGMLGFILTYMLHFRANLQIFYFRANLQTFDFRAYPQIFDFRAYPQISITEHIRKYSISGHIRKYSISGQIQKYRLQGITTNIDYRANPQIFYFRVNP